MRGPDGSGVHAEDADIKGIHAHQGQVSALECYDGHAWSAGGTSSSNCLKEWSLDGGLIRDSYTSEIGEPWASERVSTGLPACVGCRRGMGTVQGAGPWTCVATNQGSTVVAARASCRNVPRQALGCSLQQPESTA